MLCESWELANKTLVLENTIKQTNKTIWEAIWPELDVCSRESAWEPF